jgi:hypothetical protein
MPLMGMAGIATMTGSWQARRLVSAKITNSDAVEGILIRRREPLVYIELNAKI